jgi:hypothetical protein
LIKCDNSSLGLGQMIEEYLKKREFRLRQKEQKEKAEKIPKEIKTLREEIDELKKKLV